ncbi:MAG: hypothetical protein GWO77_00675 [Bacteroidetes bacterium]|nr:hypothetical protein [Bacteroidota bacterium]
MILKTNDMIHEDCMQCGARLLGRSGKKFCDDGCRNSYHNKRNSNASRVARPVHRNLRLNYTVLSEMIDSGHDQAVLEELTLYGFTEEYHTSSYVNDEGNLVKNVYDVQYRIVKKGRIQFRRISGKRKD